jgi:hypothetical protein
LLNIQTQLMTSSCTGEYRRKISASGLHLMTGISQRTLRGSVTRLHARPNSTKIPNTRHSGLFISTFNGKRRWNQLLNQLVLCFLNRKKIYGTTMLIETIVFPLTCLYLVYKDKTVQNNNCKLTNITITMIMKGRWGKY